MFVYVLYVVSV